MPPKVLLTRSLSVLAFFYAALSLTGCNPFNRSIQDGAPAYYKDVNNIPNPIVRPLEKSKYGNPTSYVVDGKRYYVLPYAKGYRQVGMASWYGTKFHGKLTSYRRGSIIHSVMGLVALLGPG